MQDNSYSLLKRIKTEHNHHHKYNKTHYFDSKIKSRTPSSKNANVSTGSTIKNIMNRLENGRKYPKQKVQKVILHKQEDYILNCRAHPDKKASFEDKEKMDGAYCHECAIQLVKYGTHLMQMSDKSLKIRAMYEEQCEKIREAQKQIYASISRYYRQMLEQIQERYVNAKKSEMEGQIQVYKFKNGHQNSEIVKNMLGELRCTKIQFYEEVNSRTIKNSISNFNTISPHTKTPASYSQKSYLKLDKQNHNPNIEIQEFQPINNLQVNNPAQIKTYRESEKEPENGDPKMLTVGRWNKKHRMDNISHGDK